MTIWTRFMDMHSGGGTKQDPYEYIYIQAPENEAVSVFYSRFGHNPNRVTCTCCGEDYSISSGELTQITAYDRRCTWDQANRKWNDDGSSLEEYFSKSDVLAIPEPEISDEQRRASVPEEGYVWV